VKAILGLGNPGLRFKFSRHNLGFLAVETLARAHRIRIKQRAFNCLLGAGTVETHEVVLGFPLKFMNLSGQAIGPLVRDKKIKLQDLLIVCDDANLPLGKIRLRPGGSAGGHNGLKSIIEVLGSEEFPRLRIGVDKPKTNKLTHHVLGWFNKREIKIIDEKLEEAAAAIELWIKEGHQAAMSKFN